MVILKLTTKLITAVDAFNRLLGCLTKSVEPQSLTRLLLTYDMHAHARENCHLADILQTELLRLFIVAEQLRVPPPRDHRAHRVLRIVGRHVVLQLLA